MNIGMLGTGAVGRTLAGKLAENHRVVLGSRDPAAAAGREEVAAWHAEHADVTIGTFAEAAAHGEMVVNATAGSASLAALEAVGAGAFDGKILLDVANPLDFSKGMPPSLTVVNTDSLAEQIQQALPVARVVKTLNTVNADVMIAPSTVAGGDHDLFICGNDPRAKETVTSLLRDEMGWRSVRDLGDITAARAMEMYLPLWVRLMGVMETAAFNVKVVR